MRDKSRNKPNFHKWGANTFQLVGMSANGIPIRTEKLPLKKIIAQAMYIALSEGQVTKYELEEMIKPLGFSKKEVLIHT